MQDDDFFDRQRRAQTQPDNAQNGNTQDCTPDESAQHMTAASDEDLSTAPYFAGQPGPTDETSGQDLLPHDARRALVYLLRQGSVLAARKSEVFNNICRYQDKLRSHLANMYLQLILDERNGLAFIANAQNDEDQDDAGESVSLITRRTLTLYDTLLILVLRKYFQDRETQGEQKVVIDIERIEAGLSPFLPLSNSTRSDRRKLAPSLTRMVEKRLLSVVRGSGDRYEISPLIRYVVSAEFLQRMLDDYSRLADEQCTATENEAHNASDND